jgi:hypothetical protein
MAGWEEAYRLLEDHASAFERVELISLEDATANWTRNIIDLASAWLFSSPFLFSLHLHRQDHAYLRRG